MHKLTRLLLAAAFLLGLTACAPTSAPTILPPAAAATTAPALAPTATVAAGSESGFDASRAFEQNRMLAVTIGKRVAGTEDGARAGDYIAQQLNASGFTVEKQAFEFDSWEDRGTQVQVTAPAALDMQARPIQYSPAGQVEAELVAVPGNGTEQDFAAVNAQGRIALVSRGTIPFSDKAGNAARAGAVAVLIYNNEPGPFSGTLRDRVTIPALALTGRDGRTLLDLVAKGAVQVKIASDTAILQKTGHNIIGTQRGSTDGILVFGGHYDSVAAGPGAVDNGSGTAVLLELAREVGQSPHKSTYVFIGFDGEELGLLGSRYYVDHLPSEQRSRIKGMLNFDMLGGGSGPLLAGGDGSLGTLARDVAQQLGITARNFSLGGNAGSDHESFQRVGIDTVFFSRDYSLLHTPQDEISQVRQEYLGEAGRVALELAKELDQKSE